jgi:Uma2 family endonuclease
MSATATQELLDPRTLLWSLTTDQYHQMIRDRVLEEGEPYELLDGQIVRKDRSAKGEDPMTVGYDHAWAVTNLGQLNPRFNALGCHIRLQQPIELPPDHEPEPDAAIVRGTVDDYRGRHPSPVDVLCVIEVADASLRRDRTTKLRIYADAGIERSLIINLPQQTIEIYTQPQIGHGRYAQSTTLTLDQTVSFPTVAAQEVTLDVRNLLP